jgi:hypothetical protein
LPAQTTSNPLQRAQSINSAIGWLVTISLREHHAGRRGTPREERTSERIGLDIDHDRVMAVRSRKTRMTNSGCWMTGRIDDNIDLGNADERFGILGQNRAAGFQGFVHRMRAILLGGPANSLERRRGALRR